MQAGVIQQFRAAKSVRDLVEGKDIHRNLKSFSSAHVAVTGIDAPGSG
jgi:hypothetical protein